MPRIVLTGVPLSTNHIYKIACRGKYPCMYMSAEGKDRKGQYYYEAKGQYKGQYKGQPLDGDLTIVATLFFKDKRKHDCDNYSKLLMDSLQGILYTDDKQIRELTVRKELDPKAPRIEVECERCPLS